MEPHIGSPNPRASSAERSVPATSRLLVLMFTDLVGSTGLKDTLTTAGFLPLLRRHDTLLREAVASAGGRLQQDTGDGCVALFATSSDAARAALIFQWKMNAEPWPEGCRLAARIGIHLGEVAETEVQQDGGPKLVGFALDLASRVMSVSRGGQILLTRSAFNDARQFLAAHPATQDTPLKWLAHGPYFFKGSEEPLELFEVGLEDQLAFGPPPDSEKARRILRPGEEQTLGWRPAVGLAMPNNPQWVVEKKIGEGGFGEVWVALHVKMKSRRVFKFCFDPERLRALKREVVLFRLLKETVGDRRDISRVIDWRFDAPPYFIEMDYSAAGNLADWAQKQGGIDKIALPARLKIVAQIARALAAAHSAGILHKDIKPSNVLIEHDQKGEYYPRLSDFGIGILTDRSRLKDLNITAAGFTHSNLTLNDSSRTGTRMYTPPECLADKPHTVQGDIYALGVLLNQMIVGDLSKPLGVGWERDVVDVDELLREDVAACVDGDPALRLSSAAALAERLETLDKRHRDRREIAQLATNKRLARRRRAQVQILAAALVFLSVIVVAFAFLWREESRQAKRANDLAAIEKNNVEKATKLEKEAETQAANAAASAREAKLLRGQGLVSEADALQLSGHMVEARQKYWQSFDDFRNLSESCFVSEVALCVSYAASPPPLLTLQGHLDSVTDVSIGPDGRTAISASEDGSLKSWDLQTGRVIGTLQGRSAKVRCVAFGPDGVSALSGDEDNTISYWDLQKRRLIRKLEGHKGAVNSIAFSANGRIALSGSDDGTVRVWDLTAGAATSIFGGKGTVINSVAISANGDLALAAGNDNNVRRWDLKTDKELRPLEGHAGYVSSIALSPDGKRVLSGSWDKTVKLWDLESAKPPHTLTGHTSPVTHVAFGPDGMVLSSSADKTIKLWDPETGNEIRSLAGHTRSVTSIAFNPEGCTALSASEDKTLKLWDLRGSREIETVQAHAGAVRAVAFGPDPRVALSGSADKTMKLWDLPTGKVLRVMDGPAKVSSVAISPNGRNALAGYWDNNLKYWDLQSGKSISTLTGHKRWVRSVAFSPDGLQALSGSSDTTLKLWDLKTGTEAHAFRPRDADRTAEITSAVFSPDGRDALSVSADATLQVWDVSTGMETRTLNCDNHAADCIAVTPDGRTALSASTDNTVELWDLQSGKLTHMLEGHTAWVSSIAVSPDGLTAVSGSADSTLKLWELKRGEEIRTLSGHTTAVLSAVFSLDGGTILTGGFDGTLRYWNFSRIQTYQDFDAKVKTAQLALGSNANDAQAMNNLGQWYAFRGKNDWAAELLEKARLGGAPVDSLTLARCYWQLSDDIPPETKHTRGEYLAAAQREYALALSNAKTEDDRFYLTLCLDAVQRLSATQPFIAPLPAN